MEQIAALDPASLPPGTDVGGWLIEAWKGRGASGTVYLAVRPGPRKARLVALKLALHPWDERFEREAELLSRIRQPNVPRLLEHGMWKHPARPTAYPYLVMEWVEGVPLYEWVRTRNPTSRQVLRLLAQVARALEATHAASGVHRDVKGDNVLVRPEDGRAVLTDFGAGSYVGAAPITLGLLPPGTPNYRSPEAWRLVSHSSSPRPASGAQPADDVFALGVSAYRLVTDVYPPSTDPDEEEARCWNVEGEGPPPPRALNPRVAGQLDALILRMLSVRPEERGASGALAEALERAAAQSAPELDEPLFLLETLERSAWPTEDAIIAEVLGHRPGYRDGEAVRLSQQRDAEALARAAARPSTPLGWGLPRLSWRAAALGGLLALWTGWQVCGWTEVERGLVQQEPEEGLSDGGTAATGDTALTAPLDSMPGRSWEVRIGVDMPRKPFPGQLKPEDGRCPRKKSYVAINGGCWVELRVDPEDCEDEGYVHEGKCYLPVIPPARPPTSAPRDGGY